MGDEMIRRGALRPIASAVWLIFVLAAGVRETLHVACPMHDGVALAQAVSASAPEAAGHHHGAAHDPASQGSGDDASGSHACDCMGDCAPGSTRTLALPVRVSPPWVVAGSVVQLVPRVPVAEVAIASADHSLPPATAPPSSV
jgi:hypothetical protein